MKFYKAVLTVCCTTLWMTQNKCTLPNIIAAACIHFGVMVFLDILKPEKE